MPPTFLGLLLLITFPLSLIWTIAAVVTLVSARGTRDRWLGSTVERALRGPTLFNRSALIYIDVKNGFWGDLGFDAIALGITFFVIWYRQGEDDDYWKGKGKKLWRSVASSFTFSPSVAPGAARAARGTTA